MMLKYIVLFRPVTRFKQNKGRIQTIFPPDTMGQKKKDQKCWISVPQSSAGAQQPLLFLPHIHCETFTRTVTLHVLFSPMREKETGFD